MKEFPRKLPTFALGLLVVLTVSGWSQDQSKATPPVLDQTLNDVDPIYDATTEEAVVLLLARAHIPGGIVEVGSCAAPTSDSRPKHSYVLSGLTPRQVLDSIVSEDTRYKWELENNVINFTPAQGLPDTLQLKIAHFEVSESDSAEGAVANLFAAEQVKKAFAQRKMVEEGRLKVILGGAPPKLGRRLVFNDTSVLDIMNAVLRSTRNLAVWHYTESVGKCKQTHYLDWPVR